MLRILIMTMLFSGPALAFTQYHLPAWKPSDVRKEIFREVWDRERLPKVLPKRKGNVLTLHLPWGFVSRSDMLHPKRWNGDFIVVNSGHYRHGWRQAPGTINRFIKAGYRVVAIDMPLTGRNTWPEELQYEEGHANHNKFHEIGPEALKLFLDPIVAVVNYLIREFPGSKIHMTGVSGGAWATTVMCGLDDRIGLCSSVAGDNPFEGNGGDYEFNHPALIERYMDLYALAACQGGKIHVYHKGDPWFPPWIARLYKKPLKRATRKCDWTLHITNVNKHTYGPRAAKIFLKALSRSRPAGRASR